MDPLPGDLVVVNVRILRPASGFSARPGEPGFTGSAVPLPGWPGVLLETMMPNPYTSGGPRRWSRVLWDVGPLWVPTDWIRVVVP